MKLRLLVHKVDFIIAFELFDVQEENNKDKRPTSSQMSSTFKDMLSQPAPELSHRQRLEWLQKRRTRGLWAQCDECKRWRYLPDVLDSYELPKQWFCRMNPDPAKANCSIPEASIPVRDEEDLIHSEYSAGSVVWARMTGWPWWPAMVDDCPDTEQYYWLDGFSDIPTHYHVVFFDSGDVTRGWIVPEQLKPYVAYKDSFDPLLQSKKYLTRLRVAIKQADDAVNLPLASRLEKYSFLSKYKGEIVSPKKINSVELKRRKKNWKRKLNIEFEISGSEDEAIENQEQRKPKVRPNRIILGTPKKLRARTTSISVNKDEVDATIEINESPAPKAKEAELSTAIDKPDTEPNTVASDNIKKASSLAVQVGSTTDSVMPEETFDNDTSKTYVPENETQDSMELTQGTDSFLGEFIVKLNSPTSVHSDDFEY